MKRVTALSLLLLAGLGGTLVHGSHADAREADRDCNEFPDQAAAQTFVVEDGGGPSDERSAASCSLPRPSGDRR